MLLYVSLTVLAVLLADWPWRARLARAAGCALRVLITLFLVFDLYMNANIGIMRAWRRAIVAQDPITSAPPAFPTFTPYQSGVSTMRREAEKDIGTINPSLLALILLGASPVLRLWPRDRPSSVAQTGPMNAA
jgi:hypothetical protein